MTFPVQYFINWGIQWEPTFFTRIPSATVAIVSPSSTGSPPFSSTAPNFLPTGSTRNTETVNFYRRTGDRERRRTTRVPSSPIRRPPACPPCLSSLVLSSLLPQQFAVFFQRDRVYRIPFKGYPLEDRIADDGQGGQSGGRRRQNSTGQGEDWQGGHEGGRWPKRRYIPSPTLNRLPLISGRVSPI